MPSSPGRRWRPEPASWPKRASSGSARASGVRPGRRRPGGRSRPAGSSRWRTAARRRARASATAHPAAAPAARPARRCRLAPMQQHVGLAAHDAGGRTGRIQQDRVEGRAIPPRRRVGRIGGARIRRRRRRRASVSLHAVAARRASTSSASSRSDGSRSSRCAALPPGAAQASSTRAPGRGRQRIGDLLRRSRPAPRARPRRSRAARTPAPARRCAARRPASVGAGVDPARRRRAGRRRAFRWRLTRSHNGAACALASKIASACRGQSGSIALRSHAGHAAAGRLGGKPSRSARRSSALTSPAWCARPSARAASTVADSAACAGRPSASSCARPASSSARRSPSRAPSGFCSHAATPRRSARAGAARRNRWLPPARGRADRQAAAARAPVRAFSERPRWSTASSTWRRARARPRRARMPEAARPAWRPRRRGHDPTRSRRAFR